MGKGRGTGGDAHRLTPQNTVPLPMAKFDLPNREQMKLSKATPSLFPQKQKKNGKILSPYCFLNIFFQNQLLLKKILLLPPPYPYPDITKKSPSLSHFS